MNNKKLGTAFERRVVELFAKKGAWAHFIHPDRNGAQPFDVIVARKNEAIAIDCKTSVRSTITLDILRDNQIAAFEMWQAKTNFKAYVYVEHNNVVYCIPYDTLKEQGKVKLDDRYCC